MRSEDWFRNTEWNEAIAMNFEAKLRRARRKEQYVRIQAGCLATKHPDVALGLIDRFLAMPDQFDQAQAYCDRARAYRSLNRLEDAVGAYEDALNRESTFPKVQTQAWIELPLMIAVEGMQRRYQRALSLLKQYKARIMFPIDGFKWHATCALILSAQGNSHEAAREVAQAVEFASREESGFRYQPHVGLVGSEYDGLRSMLKQVRGPV